MTRYLIEVRLPSESPGEFAQLVQVIRSALLRIESDAAETQISMIGLVSNGPRTYCVVNAKSATLVGKLMQAAMLPGRVLRITELDPTSR